MCLAVGTRVFFVVVVVLLICIAFNLRALYIPIVFTWNLEDSMTPNGKNMKNIFCFAVFCLLFRILRSQLNPAIET